MLNSCVVWAVDWRGWMRLFFVLLLGMSVQVDGQADSVQYSWNGPTSGIARYADMANWTPNEPPANGTPIPDFPDEEAVINTVLTGDRDIRVSGLEYGLDSMAEPKNLFWTANGGFEDKLTLDADPEVLNALTHINPSRSLNLAAPGTPPQNFKNPGGVHAEMVLDLNGQTLYVPANHTFPAMNFVGPGTIESTGNLALNTANIGAGVVVRKVFGGVNILSDGSWDLASMLEQDTGMNWQGNPVEMVYTGDGAISNLNLKSGLAWYNGGYTVNGDVNISEQGSLQMMQGVAQRMWIKGNFIDLNPDGEDYASPMSLQGGSLHFVGDGDVQQVDIRHSINAQLRIGGDYNSQGSDPNTQIELLGDFDAAASTAENPHESGFYGGTLDLNGFDMKLGDLVVLHGMNFIMDASADPDTTSMITTNRLGNIGSFDIKVVDRGGWNSGDDFVLFDYAGTKGIYNPSVGTVTLPAGWTHDGLVDTGNLGDANAPGQLILSNLTNNSVAPTPLFDFDWNQAGSGNWDTVGNWNPLGPPNGPNLSVGFLDAIEGPSTVTVDSAFTVNSIHFALTNHGYAIAGAGSVHLAASTGGSLPSINVTSSSHSFTANVVMQASATVDTATATEVAFVTLDLGGHTLTKSGAGRMTIRGVATGGSVDVQQGTLVGNEITGNLTNDGGMVSLGDDIGQLQVSGVLENTSLGTVLLKIAGSADVADSYDQIQVTGSAELAGTLEVITSATYSDPSVRGSRDDFILLSTTEGVTGVFETVNYDAAALTADFRNGDSFRSHQGNGLFRNVTYTGTQVRLTNLLALEGDADGDMDVDITDFNYLASNFAVDGYGSSASTGQVPEPTAWCLLAMSGLLLLGKWRNTC